MPRERTRVTEEQAAQLRHLRDQMDKAREQPSPREVARDRLVAEIRALRDPAPGERRPSYAAIGEALGVPKQAIYDLLRRDDGQPRPNGRRGGWLRPARSE
jgi:hypothetical protein